MRRQNISSSERPASALQFLFQRCPHVRDPDRSEERGAPVDQDYGDLVPVSFVNCRITCNIYELYFQVNFTLQPLQQLMRDLAEVSAGFGV